MTAGTGAVGRQAVAYPVPERDQRHPLNPPPLVSELQRTCPVAPVELPAGTQAWLLTRYADVRVALADGRFSADTSRPGFPTMYAKRAEPVLKGTFIRADGEEHARCARMLAKDFSPRRVEGMRAVVEGIVERLLDDLEKAGPPADLVQLVAFRLPLMAVSALLGVPPEDEDYVQVRTRILFDAHRVPDELPAARAELAAYMRRLVDAKERNPGDDLISRVVAEHVATGDMDRDELAAIGSILLAAGHESTASMIALSVLALLQHPEQLAALRRDRTRLAPAVEELLRFITVFHKGMTRVAVEDVELDGRRIAAGEGVVAMLAAANRDPAVFADPDRLDIDRTAVKHVAFGHGAHLCLGRSLARLELQAVLWRLFERFPALALAPGQELRFRQTLVYGVEELLVCW